MRRLRSDVNRFIASAMETRRPPGRPRAFDREAALEAAMRLFWRDGYDATSVSALTRAMGVTPPSLYAAFGDKRRLFLEAAERYAGPLGEPPDLRAFPTARGAAAALLDGAAWRFAGGDAPAGCLLAHSAAAPEVASDVARHRRATEEALRARVEEDVAAGRLPPGTDAAALAAHVAATIQGLAVLARDGAPLHRLLQVADLALAAWPRGVEV